LSAVPALLDGTTVVGALLVLSLVASAGLALGAIRLRGIGLGVAGVLFAGLLAGHLGVRLDERVLEFVREFGLVLFVYTIGIQVGPGFLASLRRHGLPLNLLALLVVVLGVVVALLLRLGFGIDPAALVGILAGATTNTPSLAAAQQALKEIASVDPAVEGLVRLPGIGYAVTYPFGVLGTILAMLAVRLAFRVSLASEREALRRTLEAGAPRLTRLNLEVTNPNLVGMSLERVPVLTGSGIVVSRFYRGGVLQVPRPDTPLELGDVLLAVGRRQELEDLRVVVGRESPLDLRSLPSAITTKRMIVTRTEVAGRTLDDLDFADRFSVQITRVGRAEIELGAAPGLELQYGDTVLAVGEAEDIRKVAAEIGDSPRDLNYPHLVPMFLGIALGVMVGNWAFRLPGAPGTVKLGLAGGPLLVAMALSRLGKLGPLVWYMPISANFMLREVGIVLFLAAVGLKAGDRFLETLVHGPGLEWMAAGAAVTLLPLLIVGFGARLLLRTNYLALCGVLAGSMTDPPALSFANAAARSDAPALAYVTVYPLTMLLRVLAAQILVTVLLG
jgi:putative transport protein